MRKIYLQNTKHCYIREFYHLISIFYNTLQKTRFHESRWLETYGVHLIQDSILILTLHRMVYSLSYLRACSKKTRFRKGAWLDTHS